MKALVFDAFGAIDVLHLADVEVPRPGHGEVRVRVRAASLNPIDGKIRRGELRFLSGSHFPKRLGSDFAGVVESVGPSVEAFAPGDEVYGAPSSLKDGSMAEYVVVTPATLARRPRKASWDESASVPLVAQAARTALKMVGCQAGDRILLHGCTGGVGLHAAQIARGLGAEVTGVCGTEGVEIASSFGCHRVIDYRRERITASGLRFDAILELSGKLPFDQAESLLDEDGIYADFSPSPRGMVGSTLANPFRSHKHRYVLTTTRSSELEAIAADIDAGAHRIPPVLALPMRDFADAFARAEAGGVVGKVVLRMD